MAKRSPKTYLVCLSMNNSSQGNGTVLFVDCASYFCFQYSSVQDLVFPVDVKSGDQLNTISAIYSHTPL